MNVHGKIYAKPLANAEKVGDYPVLLEKHMHVNADEKRERMCCEEEESNDSEDMGHP